MFFVAKSSKGSLKCSVHQVQALPKTSTRIGFIVYNHSCSMSVFDRCVCVCVCLRACVCVCAG